MKISKFVQSLLPFFARSRVQEDLRSTSSELQTLVLPTIAAVATEMKGPFKAKQSLEFLAAYKLTLRASGSNYFTDLAVRLPKLVKTLDAITKVVNEEFEDKIVSSAMSVRKANAVRLLGVVGFINKYTMSLVNATLHFEGEALGLQMPFISDVTPGEVARLRKYLPDFTQFLDSIASISDADKAFEAIADVLIEAEDYSDVFGDQKLDPFRIFGESQFKGNPFYIANMMVADYQHSQYKKLESQKQAVEKRMIAIRRASQGTPSPQIERDLEALTSRIASLSEGIRKYEEALA